MKILTATTLALTLLIGTAHAQDLPIIGQTLSGQIEVYGWGFQSCSQWTATAAGTDWSAKLAYLAWIQGYITGAQALTVSRPSTMLQWTGTFPITTMDHMDTFVTAWCTQHPTSKVNDAAAALFFKLALSNR